MKFKPELTEMNLTEQSRKENPYKGRGFCNYQLIKK
jgi:hypothetical protein